MYPLSAYYRKHLILLYLDSSFLIHCITNAKAMFYRLLLGMMALDPAAEQR